MFILHIITCMPSIKTYAHWIEYVQLFILHILLEFICDGKCKKKSRFLTVCDEVLFNSYLSIQIYTYHIFSVSLSIFFNCQNYVKSVYLTSTLRNKTYARYAQVIGLEITILHVKHAKLLVFNTKNYSKNY